MFLCLNYSLTKSLDKLKLSGSLSTISVFLKKRRMSSLYIFVILNEKQNYIFCNYLIALKTEEK